MDKATQLLDVQIMNNSLDENKILILNADDLNVSTTLTGLCAMNVAAAYKKPVMLGRISPDGYLKGSIRGREGSELKDLRSFLLGSGLMDYVEGHANAAGFSIKESNVDKLTAYANEKLKDINFNEGFYEADFVVQGNCSYLTDMIIDLERGRALWGQQNDEPVIIVKDITINVSDIQVIGSYKDTLKFTFNGVTYIKFKAKALIEELFLQSGKINITVAGKSNLNSFGGKTTPQILLSEIEVKECSAYDF
jgi:single-stranded-DNA-specific exonuclease